MVEPGFQKILKAFQEKVRKTEEAGEKEEKVSISENISDGMEIAGRIPEKRKRFTAPPKPYSDVIHFESRQWKYSKCKGAG